MSYTCQIKRSCIQCKTQQQDPASNRQGHFQSSQRLIDFPQQSHHDFPPVQRQDRKQIKNGEVHIQENGKLEKPIKTQSYVSAARRDDSHHARKMFWLGDEQWNSSTDLCRHLPDLFQWKINDGINGTTKLYAIHQRQTEERSQNICCGSA